MAQRRRPPVIPEIAKAYQNDPRTQLARVALQSGSSGAPVAEGGYAYADGIARVLQGAMGGMADRRSMDRYAEDEAKLLALRQQRGVDGMTGAPATPLAPPGPQGAPVPPQAAAAAAALGAPQPPAPLPTPTTPAAIPMAPIPVQGAAPGRKVPFGPSADAGSWDSAPVAEDVPDAPAPVSRPTAPQAVGPTRSKLLDTAYRIMSDANPYESAQGQEMHAAGLSDQDKMNESAAEREQRLRDMGYSAELGTYADAQSQDRGAAYAERRDVQGRNFQSGEAFKDRKFQSEEKGKDRAADNWRTRYSAGVQFAMQRSSQAFEREQSGVQHGRNLEIEGVRNSGRRKDAAKAFLSTATGAKLYDKAATAVQAGNNSIAVLEAFKKKLGTTKTGGMVLGNVPGLVKWANRDLQVLDGYTQQLVANNAKMLPGALSEKEGARLEAMGPRIGKTNAANYEGITFLHGVATRQRDFARYQIRAMEDGEGTDFLDSWTAYTETVPVTSRLGYDQWLRGSKVDRNGNVVR